MIVLISQDGYVKRMRLHARRTHHESEGELHDVKWFRILREPEGKNDLVLLTSMGSIIRFPLYEIRPMGELAPGLKVINLQEHEIIRDAIIMGTDDQ